MRTAALLLVLAIRGVAGAAPPEPTGPHPRMLLDDELRSAWRTYAKLPAGPIIGAIRLCDEARLTNEHARALYQGSEWAKVLQACLVAYAATDDKRHADTALQYFTALIDDLDNLGDHRGGDEAGRRDHGYAIRNLGPYTALAYDWLYKIMPDDLKARARQRWKAWLDWYGEKGYRARVAGSNYQAGYLLAATMISIAQAGDTPDNARLWHLVADELWGKDMAAALTADGVLAGGNWPEGWQYGPLSVAEYALAARVARRAGLDIPGIQPWLSSLMRHHVYSLSPSDTVYAGGDTEAETPHLAPHVLTLDAVALGDASPDDKKWARGELARLRLVDRDYYLYDALAAIGARPEPPPRSTWPTWYVAAATGTLYARTRWDDSAVWFVSECHGAIETDHRHPSAGTFALSRGKDDVIVDPSPYGSQSTLTSNAPTVASAQLPKDYIPSQGLWGVKTGYDFITQRASGIVAARCDYSDQYRFQQRESDVPSALRDFVLVPSADGRNAALLVIDRAVTGADDRAMDLRFRTPGRLTLTGVSATATIGSTKLVIQPVGPTSGTAARGAPLDRDCFKFSGPKGQCDAARLPVTDYRVRIPGPRPAAVHLISATDARTAAMAKPLQGDGWAGVQVGGVRDAVVVWRTGGTSSLSFAGPSNATHIVLDAAEGAQLTATREGSGCHVEVAGGVGTASKPLVAMLDAQCVVTVDPEAPAASAVGTRPRRSIAGGPSSSGRSLRSGCCSAETTPGSAFAMAFVVIGILLGRRRSVRRSSP
ncbi:MAG TPA: hypothetical protein VLB44_16920 [Kofleriaceae bacterium]|nr:hypothetical protein [Kofleriaceae bacterium]